MYYNNNKLTPRNEVELEQNFAS